MMMPLTLHNLSFKSVTVSNHANVKISNFIAPVPAACAQNGAKSMIYLTWRCIK